MESKLQSEIQPAGRESNLENTTTLPSGSEHADQKRIRATGRTAILHSVPIHYKHLLFTELKKLGLEFEVVFLARGSQIRHENIELSQDLYKHTIGSDGTYEEAPSFKRVMFALKSLNRIDPEIVVVSGYHTAESWAALFWAMARKKKLVIWFESNIFDYPRRRYKEGFKKLFLRFCSRAQVYGTSSKEYLVKLGMASENVIPKRAVVNVDLFSTKATQKQYSVPGERKLLYVGRLAPEKNISTLLNALAKARNVLKRPAFKLTIIGTGPLESYLKQQCENLGLTGDVTFEGYCRQRDLPERMRKADVFILPSTREPFGLVVLEAMLCRLPILASTQCGCTSDVINPHTGWSFSPWNEDQLASTLTRIAQMSCAELSEMGGVGHDLASRYSARNSANAIALSLPLPGQ